MVKNVVLLLAQWCLAITVEALWWFAEQLCALGNRLAQWVNSRPYFYHK